MRTILLAVSLAVISCGSSASQQDCEKLFDHILDLELQAGGAGDAKKQNADQKKKIADKMKAEIVTACLDGLPMSQIKCGMRARTMEELGKCDL